MLALLFHCVRWLFSKAFLIAAVWIITLAAAAGWLFLREKASIFPLPKPPAVQPVTTPVELNPQFITKRLEDLARESKRLQADTLREFEETKQRLALAARDYEDKAAMAVALARDVAELKDILQWILAWLSRDDQAKEQELAEKEKQLERMNALLQEKAAQREALTRELQQAEADMEARLFPVRQEMDRLHAQLGRQERVKALNKQTLPPADAAPPNPAPSPRPPWMVETLSWLEKARQHYFWPLVIATVSILIGPFLVRAAIFYLIAPLMSLAGPLRFRFPFSSPIAVSSSAASQELRLNSAETALVRPAYAIASDEHLERRTRFVFDKAYPLTSLAAGLTEMIQLRAPGKSGAPDGLAFRLSGRSAGTEMAVITLEEGAALMVRPSHIAGVIFPTRCPMRLYSHWHLFSLHAWLRLHFRHFEVVGPGKIILHAARGVRAEWVGQFPGSPAASENKGGRKRVNSESTLAFTPSLQLRSVKAETFWSYFRGRQPLYDDLWEGNGVAICQEMLTGPAAGKRSFFSKLANALWNVFGI